MAHQGRAGEVIETYPTTINGIASTSDEKSLDAKDEKSYHANVDIEASSAKAESDDASDVVLHDEREIATHVISVDDDPSLNPWTFRSFFIGLGLSAFGGSLAEIYYFKPQTVLVSLMFLAIISYVIGFAMETFIPRHGFFRYLNPHPFNKKENAFIIIMSSAAANSALATEVLAVQRLYYNITPNAASSIFLLFSSQLLGYGIGGVMRSPKAILLYPSKMLYPGVCSFCAARYLPGACSDAAPLLTLRSIGGQCCNACRTDRFSSLPHAIAYSGSAERSSRSRPTWYIYPPLHRLSLSAFSGSALSPLSAPPATAGPPRRPCRPARRCAPPPPRPRPLPPLLPRRVCSFVWLWSAVSGAAAALPVLLAPRPAARARPALPPPALPARSPRLPSPVAPLGVSAAGPSFSFYELHDSGSDYGNLEGSGEELSIFMEAP
ncbi:OPT oligopeptide transporter protein-domain-containing protein [Melanogaster broomeanus]|nr:OPT oligopeptide transporter protein-domain-containing protein [Melanogaster broomeanus]